MLLEIFLISFRNLEIRYIVIALAYFYSSPTGLDDKLDENGDHFSPVDCSYNSTYITSWSLAFIRHSIFIKLK